MEISQITHVKRLFGGILVLLLVDLIWIASSELSKYIFSGAGAGYSKPFFSTYLKTSMFSLYLLGFIFWKSWRSQCFHWRDLYEGNHTTDEAVSSYHPINASSLAQNSAENDEDKYQFPTIMKISLIFCILWFFGNFGYQEAISKTEVGVVNVVSSTSALFTLILAALFPSTSTDKYSISKCLSVLATIAGTVVISIEDIKLERSSLPIGVIWSLVGALMYACYIVFLKRMVPSEHKIDFTMFFGFVGIFNAVILWPGFFILDAYGVEEFEVPTSQQLLYMIINGFIGTMLSEYLWVWGCYLSSSLLATLAISLTIPLTMVWDVLFKNVNYSMNFYLGSIPIFASFIITAYITYSQDNNLQCHATISQSQYSRAEHTELRECEKDDSEQEMLLGESTNGCS